MQKVRPGRYIDFCEFGHSNVARKRCTMWKILLCSFISSDLRHPNILLLMAVCNSPDPSQQGLVLESVERAFLGKLLHEENTVFSEDTVLGFSRDIACAMQLVHQRGYIHSYLGSNSVVLTENFKAKVRYFANLYGLVTYFFELRCIMHILSEKQKDLEEL